MAAFLPAAAFFLGAFLGAFLIDLDLEAFLGAAAFLEALLAAMNH